MEGERGYGGTGGSMLGYNYTWVHFVIEDDSKGSSSVVWPMSSGRGSYKLFYIDSI